MCENVLIYYHYILSDEWNAENYDLMTTVTPLNADRLQQILTEYGYDMDETTFLVNGFNNGFHIWYRGPNIRQSTSNNIPLTIGTNVDIWEKIMKEISAKRVAGPFDSIPFNNYIQSPIGLVPKAGNKTRMIFHLSYN